MNNVICAVTVLAVSTAQADTIYVDAGNCPGPGDGSEAEPYCSIQTAIDNAVDTDEIVVASGTYFEAIDFLGKAIWLRGSDGPEVTTIDAQGMGSVVICVGGEGPDTVLEGFTITGGTASVGGGMLNILSSPTVTDCAFSWNTAIDGGGGMENMKGSPVLTDCTFIGNSAGFDGGGMRNIDGNPTLVNCTFIGNSAMFVGGMDSHGGSPTVTNCTFSGNSGDEGGGMYSGGSATVTNCTFSGNSAGVRGGGMFNASSGSQAVINCTFVGNTATVGGGMYNNSNSLTVTNCILWNNGPDEIFGTTSAFYSDVQGGFPGIGNIDADPLFVDPDIDDYRLQSGSPCIDAGDNTAVPDDIATDLDGNPRFLEIPETPDTGNGTLPIVDMGAYESLGSGCLAVTSQEVVCHADGTTFTVNIEGLNACTGGTTQVTFTASGGAVGQELCFTALVNDGGFCCSTEICVTIPDCTPVGLPSDLDGDGLVGIADFLALLVTWGSCAECSDCPADFDGDCSVGILDLLTLLGNWTA